MAVARTTSPADRMPPLFGMTRKERRESFEALAFLSPWLLGLLLFTGGPVIASAVLSFYEYDAVSKPTFIGVGNYQHLVEDKLFFKSLSNTLVYAVLYIPSAVCMALRWRCCSQAAAGDEDFPHDVLSADAHAGRGDVHALVLCV